ncbi:MAG TPA: hypothetical protein VLA05_04950 [Coriobacteriia bacterium]|nr:hypothetical protein [Coriobacteriia bacterium]
MNAVLAIGSGLALGVGLPYLGMRMLVPSLSKGRTAENYRGRQVFAGLGVAWLLWAGAAIVGGVIAAEESSILPVLTLAGPLALVAFTLGIVDDAYGTGADRGFKGHLRALSKGRLTTGGLKLFGIAAASYVVAAVIASAGGWSDQLPLQLALALPAGAAIALTANFVNLTDLRPGRALKVYSLLGVLGVASVVLGLGSIVDPEPLTSLVDALTLLLFVMGPVFAVWRYDLGERGMLGDAGANAAGAVAGMLLVAGLPIWGMLLYLAAMLALNAASERVSFTRLIERSPFLTRLDMIGRETDGLSADGAERSTTSERNPE